MFCCAFVSEKRFFFTCHSPIEKPQTHILQVKLLYSFGCHCSKISHFFKVFVFQGRGWISQSLQLCISNLLSDIYSLPACCSIVQFHIKSVTCTQESVPSSRFCWESIKDACTTKHGQSPCYVVSASPLCWVCWLSDATYISLFPPPQELKWKCTHHI